MSTHTTIVARLMALGTVAATALMIALAALQPVAHVSAAERGFVQGRAAGPDVPIVARRAISIPVALDPGFGRFPR